MCLCWASDPPIAFTLRQTVGLPYVVPQHLPHRTLACPSMGDSGGNSISLTVTPARCPPISQCMCGCVCVPYCEVVCVYVYAYVHRYVCMYMYLCICTCMGTVCPNRRIVSLTWVGRPWPPCTAAHSRSCWGLDGSAIFANPGRLHSQNR
jgi:hypothetical protein